MDRKWKSDARNQPLPESGCEIRAGSLCNFRVPQAPLAPEAELLPCEHTVNSFEFLFFFYLHGLRADGKRLVRFEAWLEGLENFYGAYPEFSCHLYQAESEFWSGSGTPGDPVGKEIREEFLVMTPEADQEFTRDTAPLLGRIDLQFQLEEMKQGPLFKYARARDYWNLYSRINRENLFGIWTRLRIPGCRPLEQRFPIRLVLR